MTAGETISGRYVVERSLFACWAKPVLTHEGVYNMNGMDSRINIQYLLGEGHDILINGMYKEAKPVFQKITMTGRAISTVSPH